MRKRWLFPENHEVFLSWTKVVTQKDRFLERSSPRTQFDDCADGDIYHGADGADGYIHHHHRRHHNCGKNFVTLYSV